MILKFPMPEKISANKIYAGVHWATRKKHADLYHEYISAMVKGQDSIDWEYPVDIEYVFTFKGKPLDTTNCFYMAKLCEDGLVKSGVLGEDNIEHVQYTGIYSQRGKEDGIEIVIT